MGGSSSKNQEDAGNHVSLHATILRSDYAPFEISWGFPLFMQAPPNVLIYFPGKLLSSS